MNSFTLDQQQQWTEFSKGIDSLKNDRVFNHLKQAELYTRFSNIALALPLAFNGPKADISNPTDATHIENYIAYHWLKGSTPDWPNVMFKDLPEPWVPIKDF
jgi:hypothetical protein